MTSSPQSDLLWIVTGCRGGGAIGLSFLNDLLYDEVSDSPHRQEIIDARDPHPGGETVPAGVDDPT
jgi:hypothetical protein